MNQMIVNGVTADAIPVHRFAVDDIVDHKDGGWRGAVIHRQFATTASGAWCGPEIYATVLLGGDFEGEVRHWLAEALVPCPA